MRMHLEAFSLYTPPFSNGVGAFFCPAPLSAASCPLRGLRFMTQQSGCRRRQPTGFPLLRTKLGGLSNHSLYIEEQIDKLEDPGRRQL